MSNSPPAPMYHGLQTVQPAPVAQSHQAWDEDELLGLLTDLRCFNFTGLPRPEGTTLSAIADIVLTTLTPTGATRLFTPVQVKRGVLYLFAHITRVLKTRGGYSGNNYFWRMAWDEGHWSRLSPRYSTHRAIESAVLFYTSAFKNHFQRTGGQSARYPMSSDTIEELPAVTWVMEWLRIANGVEYHVAIAPGNPTNAAAPNPQQELANDEFDIKVELEISQHDARIAEAERDDALRQRDAAIRERDQAARGAEDARSEVAAVHAKHNQTYGTMRKTAAELEASKDLIRALKQQVEDLSRQLATESQL
ncbi:uncharacterized protein F4822DRAFT_414078 [Hypoxylon trugodes]|uniref:uncharacterized protein n=1 Tax=Hypoxylon trugodes TaxID=326681 RepID=UPI0021A0835F|nr:uncharacterized protein F4822DRAFT_414078 [Hypoxylon trugodes]KAI1385751.1 hypothetical protein F4822DRAFT_414078 [Hypoxylon trugodes]